MRPATPLAASVRSVLFVPFVALAVHTAVSAALRAQALVPAGTINAAAAGTPKLVVTDADPDVVRWVTKVRDKMFAKAKIVEGAPTAEQLAGHSLLVYGTPAHPFLVANEKALPFRYGEGSVTVDGRTFRGEHLRLIAAVKNPADRTKSAVLYTAARTSDLVDINAVFHGPTEWVVADGAKTLASGSFLHDVKLSPEQMAADLAQLAATLREVHPATVDGGPEALDKALAAAKTRLGAPLDRIAFAKELAAVVLALHDAHTAIALPRRGEALDVPFVWLESDPVVNADAGPLQRGDRVVAIAGVAVAELERRLQAVVSAENAQWLRVQAPGLVTDLGALAALGVATQVPAAVRIERDGAERDVEVGVRAPGRKPAPAEWVRFTIDTERSLGVFTLDTCVADRKYMDTLAQFFAAVSEKKVKRIAVDLRANTGGNSRVVNEFLRYLAVDEFADFSGDVRWSQPVYAQRGGSGAARFDRAKPQRRSNSKVETPPPFQGELFVLIGPATFSSGNWFAAVVQDNKLGKLVGEPTGNAPSSFGDILTFTLGESGTSFTVSYKRWVRPDPTRDPADSLRPDVAVPRTRETVKAGGDPVLDWLRALK